MMTYTVVASREEDGRYSVSVPAIKGCHTWGEDLHHALFMAEDAIQGCLATLTEHHRPVPSDVAQVTLDVGDMTEVVVYRLAVREVVTAAETPDPEWTEGHVAMRHPETGIRAIVPVHGERDLPPGTLRGIVADAGLTVEEFCRLLE